MSGVFTHRLGLNAPAEVAGDAWEFIARQTSPTSNEFIFSGIDPSDYIAIMVMVDELEVDGSNGELRVRLYDSGAEETTGYRWNVQDWAESDAGENDSATHMIVADDSGAGGDAGHTIKINTSSTVYQTSTSYGVNVSELGALRADNGGALLDTTITFDEMKVDHSQTISSGICAIYGLRTS